MRAGGKVPPVAAAVAVATRRTIVARTLLSMSGTVRRRFEAALQEIEERFVRFLGLRLVAFEVVGDRKAVEHGQHERREALGSTALRRAGDRVANDLTRVA